MFVRDRGRGVCWRTGPGERIQRFVRKKRQRCDAGTLCIFDALECYVFFFIYQPLWVTYEITKTYFVMGFYLRGPYFHSHTACMRE